MARVRRRMDGKKDKKRQKDGRGRKDVEERAVEANGLDQQRAGLEASERAARKRVRAPHALAKQATLHLQGAVVIRFTGSNYS